MEKMQDARRAVLVLVYNGKDISTELSEYLTDFSYNDAPSGQLDDISITLEDRAKNWQGPWSPEDGDRINATIRTVNWEKPGEIKKLPLGSFEVDSLEFSGPPDVVSIKAVSLPVSSSIRQEKRSRSWEKVTLKTVAEQVAKRSGLKLMYQAPDNPSYDRLDQTEMSDLGFLLETATKEGIAVKVSAGKLVLFDEASFEQKPAVLTLTRGKDDIIDYHFTLLAASAAYRQCKITYTPPKAKKPITVTYTPPKAPKTGPVLKINEQVDSQAAALRVARKRLREKNKEYGKGSLTLMGDIRMAAGITINLKGWQRFDGKYIVESANHSLGSGGYRTTVEIRKVLGW